MRVRSGVQTMGDDDSIDPELLAAVRRVRIDCPGLGLKKLTQQLATESPTLTDVTAKVVRRALAQLEAEATDAAAPTEVTLPVEVIMHATDGLTLHATRTIEAGEIILDEEPLIKTAPGTIRTEQCLKAFCAASDAVQASVLELFSPLAEATLSEAIATRLSLVDAYAKKSWARGLSLQTLKKAQLAFELNAHETGEGEALFALSAKINHSCAPSANFCIHGGRLRHVALRRIEAGEPITSNYIGDHTIMGTEMRRARLYTEKLFHCACARCGSDRDLTRTVPCPGCHPRDWSGRLPEPFPAAADEARGVAYATLTTVPSSQHRQWRCARCQRSWGAREISPGINADALRCLPAEAHAAAASLDARLLDEGLLCDAVYNYTDQVLTGGRPLGYGEVASLVYATERLLGAGHWATTQSHSMRCSVLGPHLDGSSAAAAALSSFGLTAADARAEFLEGGALCWRFCAQSRQPPSVCGDAFIGAGAVSLMQRSHARRRKASASGGDGATPSRGVATETETETEVRHRALACLSGLVSPSYPGVAAARSALELDGDASDAKPAAAALTLSARADVSISAGKAEEALIFYRAALMCDPTKASIHTSLAACVLQCA